MEGGEGNYSVSSPRKTLSFSKQRRKGANNRRADSPTSDDDRASPSSSFGLEFRGGVSKEHGPKTSEVYGFVGAITIVVATVIFLVWAYVPEPWLHSIGIFYYPNRYWALAVPTYAMVTVVLALAFYVGLNFMSTPPATSLNNIFDEFSREPVDLAPLAEGDEEPIEPLSDIRLDEINALMFAHAD